MHRHRIPGSATSKALAAAVIVLAITLPLTSCSSDSDANPPSTTSSSVGATASSLPPTDLDGTTTTTIGPVTIGVRSSALGLILVDANGMTLYAKAPTTVDRCTGACLDAWPAVRATSVTVGPPSLDAALFSIVDEATGGSTTTVPADTTGTGADSTTTILTATPKEGIVAVGGRPLFRFTGDAVTGDTTGQGFNSTFWVVLADGTLVQPPPSTTTTTAP